VPPAHTRLPCLLPPQRESYPLYDRLITNMVLFEGVDPERVYLLGFSAGGDGEAARCQLLAAGCCPLAARCWPLAASCQLLA
jgi:poly(3-hydroxybutyrate) depolymerase